MICSKYVLVVYMMLYEYITLLPLDSSSIHFKNKKFTYTIITNLLSLWFLLFLLQALRGATQIINLAIETLQKELPPVPPTPQELRMTESQAKQEVVTQLRLNAIRNRGKPVSTTDNTVGRL